MGSSYRKVVQVLTSFTICFTAILFIINRPVFAGHKGVYTVQSVNMIPFYWLVGVVGGSIMITLLYVSWKKYNAEQKRKKQRKDS